ncbi:Tudor and KH domain-containing protein [Harpegnathos saltator]|uniref:Tudor and KH domain-containing protein n=2 Tax=Harpegnathos saltator TaxID=610380 RepID=E2BAZ8_HARSA|nr:Tudor and KH domain-containing protein [Harpegnathos saltator]
MYYDDEDNHSMHILKEVTIGKIVAAKDKRYNQWYRGEITKILKNFQYEVFLLDYGDVIECSKEDILELRTDMLGLRLQAVECTLANVKPKEDKWTQLACEEFASYTWLGQSKVIDATVKGYIQRPVDHEGPQRENSVILCVELYDRYEKLQVGEHLTKTGHADFKEDVHSEMTDIVTSVMKRQFLSVRLLSKVKCLTTHAQEGEMNKDKSVLPNIFGSTGSKPSKSLKTSEPLKSLEPTKLSNPLKKSPPPESSQLSETLKSSESLESSEPSVSSNSS